jgi:hypothetical protein
MGTVNLDLDYPHLSRLIATTHGLTLQQLADRAPASGYPYFDLERLCHNAKEMAAALAEDPCFGAQAGQVLGYLSVIDEYIALGILKSPKSFAKKLIAPKKALAAPPGGTELLDTIVECQWGMQFHEDGYSVEEEVPFPGGGDADFRITDTRRGLPTLWVDSISPEPRDVTPHWSTGSLKWPRGSGRASSPRRAAPTTCLRASP